MRYGPETYVRAAPGGHTGAAATQQVAGTLQVSICDYYSG